MKKNIAVFGLGSMGYGIAKSLLKAGHRTTGFDVAQSQIEKFVSEGGIAGDFSDIEQDIDIVMIVVLNAEQTRSVLLGKDGCLTHLNPGACVIACATVPPDFAREMEERCNAVGVHYLDAPISGGAVKAAAGQLSVMAAGKQAAFDAAEPALQSTAEKVFRLGDSSGPGSAMKAVNQLLAGVHIASMAEAMTFGMTQGMDPKQIVEVISQCAGTSWMFENRAPHVVEGDYTPHSSVDIWPKDLGIVLDIAKQSNFSAPLTAAALQQFIAAAGSGLGHEDDAAVAKVYARNAGLQLPEK